METIIVNQNIRLEILKLWMAEVIFSTINSNREYLAEWLPFVDATLMVDDTKQFIQSLINQPPKKKNQIYSIWYKNEFAGLIGLKDTDWVNHKTEIGYWLAEKMQKKGIITLSTQKLIKYCFSKLKINRVQIKVAVGNQASKKIPERLGFTFEGIERCGEFHKNNYLDLSVYSLLKSD